VALDEFIEHAAGRGATYGRPALADRATAQSDLAKAEAELRSARSWLLDVTEQAFGCLSAGGDLDVTERMQLRLAATHAARSARRSRGPFTGYQEPSGFSRKAASRGV
jgi:hypothetical protein